MSTTSDPPVCHEGFEVRSGLDLHLRRSEGHGSAHILVNEFYLAGIAVLERTNRRFEPFDRFVQLRDGEGESPKQ